MVKIMAGVAAADASSVVHHEIAGSSPLGPWKMPHRGSAFFFSNGLGGCRKKLQSEVDLEVRHSCEISRFSDLGFFLLLFFGLFRVFFSFFRACSFFL